MRNIMQVASEIAKRMGDQRAEKVIEIKDVLRVLCRMLADPKYEMELMDLLISSGSHTRRTKFD